MTRQEAYKQVLEDLMKITMFTGKYDAANGSKDFMYGILTVMDVIADRAGNDTLSNEFIDNMMMSKKED